MRNLRPMSEKPTRSTTLVLVDEDSSLDDRIVKYYTESEVVYYHGSQHGKLFEVLSQEYTGWRYLIEDVEVEWTVYEGSGNRTSYIGKVMIHVHQLIGKQGWYFKVANIHNNKGPYDSTEEAQPAAIKWYNENLANLPEVK